MPQTTCRWLLAAGGWQAPRSACREPGNRFARFDIQLILETQK